MALRPLQPRQGESLADFFARALARQRTNPYRLSRQLGDGKHADDWERTFRRWASSATLSMSADNAEVVSRALDADFRRFVRGYASAPDLLRRALARLDALERRVQELEAHK